MKATWWDSAVFAVTTNADLRNISSSGANFPVDELEEAVDIRGRNALVARTVQELCRDRKTLVFCVTVQHARNLAAALTEVGVPAGLIHGELGPDERAAVLAAFREGTLRAITNVGVLTEGFDEPSVSCVAMARPTRSESLYTQCVGRGTRLFPGKQDCLVLDFVDLSDLSLVTLPSLFGLPGQLDLAGGPVTEAAERLGKVFEQFPTFELAPEAITLSEIETRAQQFDPLTLHIDPEVTAISGNAWTSLGRVGLVLHFLEGPQQLGEFLILDRRYPGRDRYLVFAGKEEAARFSRLTDAVEAVDYEVAALGPLAERSARPSAAWRSLPVSDAQLAALARLSPPAHAETKGHAVRLLAFGKYTRRQRGAGREA